MEFKAFIFDFDGVIADSVEVKTTAFATLFARFGNEIETKVVNHHRNHGGMTRMEKFKHYYTEFLGKEISEKELDDLAAAFSSMVVDNVVAADPIDGVNDFLKKWHESVMCFIDSATPDEEIVEIVERRGLTPFFHDVMGSGRSKTDNLRVILAENDLAPADCLFFGDAYSDFKAANECGVAFIGILPDTDAPLLKKAPDISWYRNFDLLLADEQLLNG